MSDLKLSSDATVQADSSKWDSLRLSTKPPQREGEAINCTKMHALHINGPHTMSIGATTITVPEGKIFIIEVLENEIELKTIDK